MNKKLIILIGLFLLLIASSLLIPKLNNSPNPPLSNDNEVKGDTKDICLETQGLASDIFQSLAIERKWYVKSPYIENNNIKFEFDLPKDNVSVSYSLNEETFPAQYIKNKWSIDIPIETLDSNEYKLIIKSEICEAKISKSFSFKVSNPVYVVWSIDWEGFDVKDKYLDEMARISKQYSAPMTHFFNPYIYIYLSSSRASDLTNWVKSRDGESIGLHIHMYNKLVQASGVTVNNDPAWGSPTGNGHDTPNSNYGYDDYKRIIQWSLQQYEKNGLEQPTMYRAGGWYIDEENILVLKNLGFYVESSGRTFYKHGSNLLEGPWNLKENTQPYQMNSKDQNITDNPDINIWEYPNNGGDSWAFSTEKLISRFKANYNGGIAKSNTVITFISHPHWFDKEGPNIEGVLKYISNSTYSSDNGPVIFITLDKVHQYTVKQ